MSRVIMIESLRHMFGVTSSPNVSNFILKLHAERNKDKISQEAYLALLEAMYVDDLLESIDDKDTARRIKAEITDVLKSGGFEICKWKANFPDLDLPSLSSPTSQNEMRRASELATPTFHETLE